MARRRRITRSQLKRDAFVEKTFEFTEYFKENWRSLAWWMVAVSAGLILWFGGKSYIASTRETSENLLAAGVKQIESKNYNAARDSLKLLLKGYKASTAGEGALFYTAETYYNEKNYTEAERTYREYLDKYGYEGKYSILAAMSLGSTIEQQGKLLPAAEVYLNLAKNINIKGIARTAKIQALRCLMRGGNLDDAEKLAIELIAGSEDPQQANFIKLMLGEIRGAKMVPVQSSSDSTAGS